MSAELPHAPRILVHCHFDKDCLLISKSSAAGARSSSSQCLSFFCSSFGREQTQGCTNLLTFLLPYMLGVWPNAFCFKGQNLKQEHWWFHGFTCRKVYLTKSDQKSVFPGSTKNPIAQNVNILHFEGEDGQHSTAQTAEPEPGWTPSPAVYPRCYGAVLLRICPGAITESAGSKCSWRRRNCGHGVLGAAGYGHISVLPKDRNVQLLVKNKEFDGFICQQQ